MGPCNLEIHEICAILVKSADSQLFGRINSCLENFVFFAENGHYLVKSVGLTAIRMNKFLTGEFRVFRGKMVIIGFGHCHGNLAVK